MAFPFPRPRRAARGNRLGSGLRGAAARRRRPAAPAVAGALSLLAATLAGFAAAPANAATGAAEPVVSVSDLSEDYAAYLDGTYDGELAPSPLDLSYLADSLAAHSALRAAELPSSFDLRETNRIGGMLNQHETENCWAFASLSLQLNMEIVPGKTLIILDEIQACPKAITAHAPPSTPRPRRSPSMRTCIPCTPRTAPSCTTGTRSPPGPCPTRRTASSWR